MEMEFWNARDLKSRQRKVLSEREWKGKEFI